MIRKLANTPMVQRFKKYGKRGAAISVLCIASLALAADDASGPVDRFKPALDHLQSLLNDSGWDSIGIDKLWSSGARVFRRRIQVPETFNGYAVRGARLTLDLTIESNGPLSISVFSNGSMVYHGNQEMQQPILLTENASPGERFLLAVRVDAQPVPTRIASSRLVLQPPPNRPDPALLRDEMLAAQPMVAAYPESASEHRQQLDAALAAIDFSSLDRGDQAGFDESLRRVQGKLDVLKPWMKQFSSSSSIRAVGN